VRSRGDRSEALRNASGHITSPTNLDPPGHACTFERRLRPATPPVRGHSKASSKEEDPVDGERRF